MRTGGLHSQKTPARRARWIGRFAGNAVAAERYRRHSRAALQRATSRNKDLARRQMGSLGQQLQRLGAAQGQARRYCAELRWIGRKLLRARVRGLVAGFDKDGGLSRAPGLSTARSSTSNLRPPISFSRNTRRSITPNPATRWTQPQPVLFHIETKKQFIIDNTLFPNPYQLSRIEWRKDSRAFTFEYNQRGHQVYRVIEVDAATAKPRAVISEEPKTFFCYSGKRYRYDVSDGKEVIWMSERDGWNHLVSLRRRDRHGKESDHERPMGSPRR